MGRELVLFPFEDKGSCSGPEVGETVSRAELYVISSVGFPEDVNVQKTVIRELVW